MPSTILTKKELRNRRHARVRSTISGTAERPRLAVYKSNKFISAQLIDDTKGATIAAAHGKSFGGSLTAQAAAVGKAIAEAASKAAISSVVFDRGGYAYAGQVKGLADAAREAGLNF